MFLKPRSNNVWNYFLSHYLYSSVKNEKKFALKYGIMPGCLLSRTMWGLRLDMTFHKSTVTKLRVLRTAFVNVTLLIYQQTYLAINCQIVTWSRALRRQVVALSGPPRLARPPRPGPCLDFGFQYTLIRNNRSKKFGDRILGIAWLKFDVTPLFITEYL